MMLATILLIANLISLIFKDSSLFTWKFIIIFYLIEIVVYFILVLILIIIGVLIDSK